MARRHAGGTPTGHTILVVDDQLETLESARLLLEPEGHNVLVAESGEQALDLFGRHDVHLMLVDYFMPQMTGEELIAEIRRVNTIVRIILHTGYAGDKPAREMMRMLDIQGYHDKTDDPDRLLLWVDAALKEYSHLRRTREIDLLKSQMLANISHELRTPLHVVLGYTELLHDQYGTNHDLCESLERVRWSALLLHRTIEDLLHLADLDAGVASAEIKPIAEADLRAELMMISRQLIRDKPIAFVCNVPEGLPPLAGDPAKIQVVLNNLLSNAVKFTDAGQITVSAETCGDTVQLSISDTGIGIAPEDQLLIFEPFRQRDGSDSRRYSGNGVGLTVARGLARLMGGDITVNSAVGEGSTFSLRLPLATPASAGGLAMPRASQGAHTDNPA